MYRVSAAVLLLGSILFVSCAAPRRSKGVPHGGDRPAPLERPDTAERFVPTHPPVVVPHTWREEMRKKSGRTKRTERMEQTGETE